MKKIKVLAMALICAVFSPVKASEIKIMVTEGSGLIEAVE